MPPVMLHYIRVLPNLKLGGTTRLPIIKAKNPDGDFRQKEREISAFHNKERQISKKEPKSNGPDRYLFKKSPSTENFHRNATNI